MNVAALKNRTAWLSIFKGCLFALCFSLIAILIFAFVLRFIEMGDMAIKIVNQIIKTLSILFGVFICLKSEKDAGLIKDLFVAVIYTIVSFLVFSILSGAFSFGTNLIFDVLFSIVIGFVSSMLVISISRK